jgi:predicted AAA+ superfamily ATPase
MLDFHKENKKYLTEWYNRKDRMPLLVRGARQVGKSYAIKAWAREHLGAENLLEINLEERPQLKSIFEKDLVVERIIDDLNLYTGFDLRAPNKILFIDEIQYCPQAIMALRYFYEKAPEIAVIGAGSLIEFVLKKISFPVGRIESLYFTPVTFFEFIDALGRGDFVKHLIQSDLNTPVPELIHRELLDLLTRYYRVGGMPKAIATYVETQNYNKVSEIHHNLLQTYRDDFAKYGEKIDWGVLRHTFSKIPFFVCKGKIIFAKIDQDTKAEKTRAALELLNYAGLIYHIYATSGGVLPLSTNARLDNFKLLFLDIGLLQHALGYDWQRLAPETELTDICEGQFAEQFVGQELIAAKTRHSKYALHYWDRNKPGSNAEVDYLIEYDNRPTPIEVKSGSKGTLRSLRQFIAEYAPQNAIVLSQRNIEMMEDIKLIPLYFACKI